MLQEYNNDSRIQEDDYPKKGAPLILVLLLHPFHLQDILQKQAYFHKLLYNTWVLFYRWENKVIGVTKAFMQTLGRCQQVLSPALFSHLSIRRPYRVLQRQPG